MLMNAFFRPSIVDELTVYGRPRWRAWGAGKPVATNLTTAQMQAISHEAARRGAEISFYVEIGR